MTRGQTLLFGASMAAAGSQPGATFAGSVGKGYLGGYQASQNAAANQSEIGLRRAQTQNVGIEARQKAIGLNMPIQQMNCLRAAADLVYRGDHPGSIRNLDLVRDEPVPDQLDQIPQPAGALDAVEIGEPHGRRRGRLPHHCVSLIL
jgi:hypothetical protein